MCESVRSFLCIFLVSCYCRYWCSYCEASVSVFGRHGWARKSTLYVFNTVVVVGLLQVVVVGLLQVVVVGLLQVVVRMVCVFQVCLLSKVIPGYVALSVCCSFVSSNIIFMGFDLVDKVKSIVKDLDLVLFIFTHQSCAQLDKLLVASWSRTLAVVAYYCVLLKTKSSTYIAHFTGDGNFLIRSLMNTKKSVGDMTPPCGIPCLKSIFFVLSRTTIAGRLCRYDLIQRNIFPTMLHFFSFSRSRPSVQTVSNAFCKSIHTVSVCFLCWKPSSISCAIYVTILILC